MRKIAIHHVNGSYSDDWIRFCDENNIEYKVVNCYSTNIIEELKDCSALMWHHNHASYKDVLTAKKILRALESKQFIIYPNTSSNWHFDDKIAQMYLLQCKELPLVKSYVFYDKAQALEWARNTDFPKVFKLKGGAGSQNVRMVRNLQECKKIINKSFSRGWSQYDRLNTLKERIRLGKQDGNWKGILKGIYRLFFIPFDVKMLGKERGYVYFQDFIPNNTCDYRIQVVCEKAWAMRRMVRKNDFRASGSNQLSYDQSAIPKELIALSFRISKLLDMSTIAIDFVLNKDGKGEIVEICYCFGIAEDELNHGYWTNDLVLHKEIFDPFGDMVLDIKKRIIN